MQEVADKRPTVVLTGFGPFPGIPVNASALIVRKLAPLARRAFPGGRFVVTVLPTEWRRAPELIANLHARYRPVLALHFGVAAGTRALRLETMAENVCRAIPDAAALLPLAATLSTEPGARRATIDIPAIAHALNAHNIPCSISNDAGGYLCNAVLYQSLARARADCKVGFIHIPADLSEPPLDLNGTAQAALIIIASALETTLRSA